MFRCVATGEELVMQGGIDSENVGPNVYSRKSIFLLLLRPLSRVFFEMMLGYHRPAKSTALIKLISTVYFSFSETYSKKNPRPIRDYPRSNVC